MRIWVDVTFSYGRDLENPDRVHFRVLATEDEDWSGWADSEEEAMEMARRRREDIEMRAGWGEIPDAVRVSRRLGG